MSDRLTVTLYIPCYNGEAYIAGCIESVLRQFRRPDEILVIDDGSTDRTAEIAARYDKVRVIRHERNRGLAAARNTALAAATGDLVASLDADCIADKSWLYRLLLVMKQMPDNVAGIGGKLVEAFDETPPDRFRATYMCQHKGDKRIPGVAFIAGANTVFRRSALEQVGGYNEAFRTNGEDVHICHLLRHCGHLVIYEPGATVLHQRRDTVRSVVRMNWAHWSYPSVVIFPPTTLRRAARRMWLRTGYCARLIAAGLRGRQYRLLPIMLLCAAVTPWWALRDWWRLRRSGTAGAAELTAQRIQSFETGSPRVSESSAEPQAQYS